ncbi:asparagine synthetase domain-containing protein 1-like isoform X3 [Acropora millepora]|uniref:asparagine synthetase domain-containing protein 1-like isoform X3 n=1 Tax=Acropora millepora TaxID=45264 RepID=UPI001CF51354|nr:asparagine synthetase domain-containing protein 1-like isoform X3 [Acropora millepora]
MCGICFCLFADAEISRNCFKIDQDENDTSVLLKTLSSHVNLNVSLTEHVLSTMSKVQGPWSFVYWQATEKSLWFGRDYFGRRSLLWHLPSNPTDVLVVTSVAERNCIANDTNLTFEEIPADGLYCVDLSNTANEQDQPFSVQKFEWKQNNEGSQLSLCLTCPVAPFNKEMPGEHDAETIEENRKRFSAPNNPDMSRNLEENQRKVKDTGKLVRQVNIINGEGRVHVDNKGFCVKTSGKTDLLNLETENASFNPYPRQILHDTIANSKKTLDTAHTSSTRNVEFSSGEGQSNSESLQKYREETDHNLCTPNEASDVTNLPDSCNLNSLELSEETLTFENFMELFVMILGEAVKKRVFNLPRTDNDFVSLDSSIAPETVTSVMPPQEQTSVTSLSHVKEARIGVLFSGGIDSMMISALADKFVPEDEAIDLINVAFEQKPTQNSFQNKDRRKTKLRQGNARQVAMETPRKFDVPDRLTGISGLEELQRQNPTRQWNFIEVDVTVEELQEMRSSRISHLVSPLKTVLDDSIGCALWFAARGRGHLRASISAKGNSLTSQEDIYSSKAKVLLVGMGADEQLGGYSRHRTRFINEGWKGLMEEMEMEVKRISKRNLGRDDRCISDHGREARFPFLDEEVVSFLNSLPVWLKTDPGLPRGTGEKLLLRQAARMLGLTSSSELPKRAIQFGSRIAKLESSGEKGSEACARLEC